ncbi:hypothetical protein Pelo_8256 [Pelomyxa schiedti]|nr:hypothetical protein Pelo_8256 [Pelomyxa schiedti]
MGCAGTGKSLLLRRIVDLLKSTDCRVAVTALTGIAAVNIGGVTLHHWAGSPGCVRQHHLQLILRVPGQGGITGKMQMFS